ncbi:MAG: hypothetical protein WBW32_18285 [Luteibacter sp.]
MRPPEIDVTYFLEELFCYATDDSDNWFGDGDEPYLWVLGFKVDADTMAPPAPGSLIPTLNVQVIENTPFFKHVVGAGHVHARQEPYDIAPQLGTRSFRLKPALLPVGGWFPGLAGVICLAWDQDGFSPATGEAGYARFKKVLGPELSKQFNALLGGAFDTELAKDGNGNPTPIGGTLPWRLARLADADGRRNAVKELVSRVKSELSAQIKDAFVEAAGLDELLDPDDLLGAAAQVNLGTELVSGMFPFSLTFTDAGNYRIDGKAIGKPVHKFGLKETPAIGQRALERVILVQQSICGAPPKDYLAFVFRQASSTRLTIESQMGPPPSEVRWILDGQVLPTGTSTVAVQFATPTSFGLSPGGDIAAAYPGGPGTLTCTAQGASLDIVANGSGTWSGDVTAVIAFSGDPSLSPTPPPGDAASLAALGYERSTDVSLATIEIEMSDDYIEDVTNCMKKKIKQKLVQYVPFGWGTRIDRPEPPEWLDVLALIHDLVDSIPATTGSRLHARDFASEVGDTRRIVRARWLF